MQDFILNNTSVKYPYLQKNDNGHPSKFIEINGKSVEIDEELIPLIKELNKVGLVTTQCCQGGKNTLADEPKKDCPAHIVFEMGSNMTVEIKPIGAYDKQNLVISWKKNERVLF